MRLDDPEAVAVLTDLVKLANAREAWRPGRMAELKAAHDEYVQLEQEQEGATGGRATPAGLRIQLAFALLYREIGTDHVKPYAIPEIILP